MKNDKVILQGPGEYEITFREGPAEEIQYPKGYSISGSISAPAKWYTGKLANDYPFEMEHIHVLVDSVKGEITLKANDEFPDEMITISGFLHTSDIMRKFDVNGGKAFSFKEIIGLIKSMKYFFPDKEEHTKLLIELQNINATVLKTFEQKDDLKGNKVFRLEQEVQSKFKGEFKLNIPLFTGSLPSVFRVETIIDLTDNDIRFKLFSDELYELIEKEKSDSIDTQLNLLSGLPIVFIQ